MAFGVSLLEIGDREPGVVFEGVEVLVPEQFLDASRGSQQIATFHLSSHFKLQGVDRSEMWRAWASPL